MTNMMTQTNTFASLADSVREARAWSEPAWFLERRGRGARHFAELGFPSQKLEDWKYTNIKPVAEAEYQVPGDEASVSAGVLAEFEYGDLDAHRFVFVNGVFQPALSHLDKLPKGVTASTLREALTTDNETFRKYFGAQADIEKHHLTALNAALVQDGFFLAVAPNTVVEKPFHLLFLTTSDAEPAIANLHNVIVLGTSAQATILETHGAAQTHRYLKNIVTEIDAAPNAHLDRYVVQRESVENGWHISSEYVHQGRDSNVRSHSLDFGGDIVRHNIWAKLDGEAAEAVLNGLYMLRGNQHVDNFMWVEHTKENIPSHELFKGILDEHASAAFTGRIYVHKEAQKTDAKQTNQNLLLSDTARANTRPQLEIYADDVKCTHGATIGQLDEQALFYLRSRGVDPIQARNLLIHAFASDITERIRIPQVLDKAEELLTTRLRESK